MKHLLFPTVIAGVWLSLLAACTPNVTEGAPVPANIMPEELKDCKFFRLSNEHGNVITVVRCPNSTVSTTQHQKSPVTTVTIDGAASSPAALSEELIRANAQLDNIHMRIKAAEAALAGTK